MDVTKCGGCRTCQIACKDEHCGNDWMPYARPQPDTGQFWLKVNEYVRGTVPKVKLAYVPVMCQHCDNAPCVTACPNKAISQRQDGLVILDPAKCRGSKLCLDACPYGAIYFNKDLGIAQKCTGCAHLLDRGWAEPRCADSCPTGAIHFGEEADIAKLPIAAKAEVLAPKSGAAPKVRVKYVGLPKRFVAGTLYDPVKKEIIEGATCTLTGEGVNLTTKTDGFGDFWFDGLAVGKYSLKIEGDGKTKTIDVQTQKDVSLGDVPIA